MPVFVEQRPVQVDQLDSFSRVLRDDPTRGEQLAAQLQRGDGLLFAGIFNGAAVAVAGVTGSPATLSLLVVHPATRGRGVGREVLRQVARAVPDLVIPEELAELARSAGL